MNAYIHIYSILITVTVGTAVWIELSPRLFVTQKLLSILCLVFVLDIYVMFT